MSQLPTGQSRRVGRGFLIVASLALVAAIGQVTLGGVVRITDSGLGCPDWPLCHGKLIPPAEFHTLIEYSHRLSASLLGVLVLAAAVLAWKFHRTDRRLTSSTTLGLALVLVAAVLGGITVLTELGRLGRARTPDRGRAADRVHHRGARGGLGRRPDCGPGSRRRSIRRAGGRRGRRHLADSFCRAPTWWARDTAPAAAPGPCAGEVCCRLRGRTSSTWPTGSSRQRSGRLSWPCSRSPGPAGTRGRTSGRCRWSAAALLAVQTGLGAVTVWWGFPLALRAVHLSGATLVWAAVVSVAAFHYVAAVPGRGRAEAEGAAMPRAAGAAT